MCRASTTSSTAPILAPSAKGDGWYSFDEGGVHFVGLINVLHSGDGGVGTLGAAGRPALCERGPLLLPPGEDAFGGAYPAAPSSAAHIGARSTMRPVAAASSMAMTVRPASSDSRGVTGNARSPSRAASRSTAMAWSAPL